MRVTFLVANYAPSIGGAQLHVQQLAEGLVGAHGHTVEVVTTDALRSPNSPAPGRIPRRVETIGGVVVRRHRVATRATRVIRTARRGRLLPKGPTRLAVGPLGARLWFDAYRAGGRADVVVSVTAPSALLTPALHGASRGRSAFVVMPLLHLGSGSGPPEWSLRAIRAADGCTSATPFERDWLVQRGVAPERLAILPPGCRPDRYPELTATQARARLGLVERPTIGCVGRLAAHKGIDTLLASARRIWAEEPEVTLLLAGSRAGWDGFDELVRAIGPVGGDRVVVRESFSEEDRPLMFAACDVIANPSREESFGMVNVEAWCARRPVVAGDIPAVRSLVHPGEEGELVPVDDPEALADAVLGLLRDPMRRARYGAEGRRRAEVEFGVDRIVDGWDEFLRTAVDRSRRDRRGPVEER